MIFYYTIKTYIKIFKDFYTYLDTNFNTYLPHFNLINFFLKILKCLISHFSAFLCDI